MAGPKSERCWSCYYFVGEKGLPEYDHSHGDCHKHVFLSEPSGSEDLRYLGYAAVDVDDWCSDYRKSNQ